MITECISKNRSNHNQNSLAVKILWPRSPTVDGIKCLNEQNIF